MNHIIYWSRKASEGAVAAMLAALFLTFLLQIFSRYILQEPFAWTLEVCLTLWLWLIFFGNSFVLQNEDQVKFEIVYNAARPKIRRVMALIGALSIVVAMLISFLPTWSFIDFLKIKPSTILQIPMRNVFIIYMVFMCATIIRYSYRLIHIVRFGMPDLHGHVPPYLHIEEKITKQEKL